MKALFGYPEFERTFWNYKYTLKFVGKRAAFPPTGLLTVAAMLPWRWQKKLVDINVCQLSDEQIDWADIVFISAMIAQKPSTMEVISRCRKLGKKIVLGGPILETGCQEFGEVDHLFLGEAEDTLPLFLQDLEAGRPKKVYDGRGQFPDIAKTPIPLWKLNNPEHYASGLLQFSRGCPFRCKFCNIAAMNGRNPRTKPPANLLRELAAMHDAGFRGSVLFADDNLIGNKAKAKEMLRELVLWQEDRDFPFRFTAEVPITIADDPELMQLMVGAGFDKVFLGLETPIRASLIECGKLQNAQRDMGACIKKIQNSGLQPMSGFIVGFDSDPPATFADEMIDFIQGTGIVVAMVGVLQAPPGTELYARLEKEGRIENEASGNNTDCRPNFVPEMPVETLVAGYKKIVGTVYSPNKYYERIRVFLREHNASRRIGGRTNASDFKAFLRSIWYIGLFGGWRTSWYYWKTLFVAFFSYRQAFPKAVALWIYGAHFQKIAKEITKS